VALAQEALEAGVALAQEALEAGVTLAQEALEADVTLAQEARVGALQRAMFTNHAAVSKWWRDYAPVAVIFTTVDGEKRREDGVAGDGEKIAKRGRRIRW
jgi:hypothetical protein